MEGPVYEIKYPVFGLEWATHKPTGKKIIVVAGGGGSSKSGLQNCVTLATYESPKVWEPCVTIDSKSDLITNVGIHPTGTLLAAGIENTTVLYSIDKKCVTSKKLLSFQTDFATDSSSIQNVAKFNHSGNTLATGGEDGVVRLWKIVLGDYSSKDYKPMSTLSGHTAYISSITFSPSDDLIATSAKDGKCIVWNAVLTNQTKIFCTLPNASKSIPKSSKGKKKLATYNYRSVRFLTKSILITIQTPPRGDSYLSVWKVPTLEEAKKVKGKPVVELCSTVCLGSTSACTLSVSGGRYVAVGGSDGSVTLFMVKGSTVKKIRTHPAHHLPVTGIAFKPNDDEGEDVVTLMSSSADYSLFLMKGHGTNVVLPLTLLLLLLLFLAFAYWNFNL